MQESLYEVVSNEKGQDKITQGVTSALLNNKKLVPVSIWSVSEERGIEQK